MRCPYCFNEDTKVVDKRDSKDSTRRRRECLKCEKRFTTYERTELSLVVIKKDGRKEEFSREKLKKGLLLACEKRPNINEEDIEEIVDIIEAKLMRRTSNEIDSRIIGEMVMKKLLKMDKVAYVRFATVYRSFGDVKDIEKELKMIKEK
jgi:transcriptional repressor NrdR